MENLVIEESYQKISEIINNSRKKAYSQVNYTMIEMYFSVGKEIDDLLLKYGNEKSQNQIIWELSSRLSKQYGSGFERRSLRNMAKFYNVYKTGPAVRAHISWTHYKLLITIENKEKREFYENEIEKNCWSTRQLERQINSCYYERIITSHNVNNTQSNDKNIPFIKDPYILEFLDLKENAKFYERDLESNLIDHLSEFLLELGSGFSFVARQKKIDLDGEFYYVDLVFYNYILKCFVLIDLKTTKLTHQDIGQIDFYVRYFDNEIRGLDDNPTIGIILCADKNETLVKYSVLSDNNNLFASKYKIYMPSIEKLTEEINKEIRNIENQIVENSK